MAWLQRHGRGWRVCWREGGIERRGPILAPKAVAAAALRQVEAEQAARRPVRRGEALTWEALCRRWQATRPVGRYREQALQMLLRLPWRTPGEVTAAAVAAQPPGRIRVIRSVLAYADGLGLPIDPRAARQRPPAAPRRPEVPLLSDGAVEDLIARAEAWSPADGAIAHLIATYGHRAQSLVGLPAGGVDLEDGTITMEVKGGDRIRHPLLPATVARLRPLVEAAAGPAAPLFVGHLGKPWKDGRAWAAFFAHHVSGSHGYYQLKRYAITRMLGLGLDAKTVASITGHRTVSLLLNTYARTNETRQRAAIAALATQTRPTEVTTP